MLHALLNVIGERLKFNLHAAPAAFAEVVARCALMRKIGILTLKWWIGTNFFPFVTAELSLATVLLISIACFLLLTRKSLAIATKREGKNMNLIRNGPVLHLRCGCCNGQRGWCFDALVVFKEWAIPGPLQEPMSNSEKLMDKLTKYDNAH